MGMVFIDPADPGPGKAVVERSLAAEGLTLRAWRTVPVDESSLGEDACTTAPLILQALFTGPQAGSDAGERRAFRARRRLEQTAHLERLGLHVSSLSFRTVVYKALCAADQLDGFYLDLAEPSFEGWFALFHQRFSTNTTPSWERAQPFRTLAHNGEINTIRGNQAMMFARAGRLGAGSLAPEGLLSPCWRHRARIPECSIRPSGVRSFSGESRWTARAPRPWTSPASCPSRVPKASRPVPGASSGMFRSSGLVRLLAIACTGTPSAPARRAASRAPLSHCDLRSIRGSAPGGGRFRRTRSEAPGG
ncbi:MAG TPA: hypothetical protein VE975_07765, partial [Actinomycetota bacterium]|nr:hypothetical protein [Actinomycetota bacterium]